AARAIDSHGPCGAGGTGGRPMICAACGFDSPANMKFCGSCGRGLVAGCASCGAENPPGFRFCGGCGRPLVAEPRPPPPPGSDAAAAARKVVTIVFADLIGSTSLHERLDPESVGHLMDRYYKAVREPIEAHGGSVVQLLGDGVMCAFGVPHVAEDDAIRAVRAAVGMQRAFGEFAREQSDVAGHLGLRVRVN